MADVGGDPSQIPVTVVTPVTVAVFPLIPVTLRMVGSALSAIVYLIKLPVVTTPINPPAASSGADIVEIPALSLAEIDPIPIEIIFL